MKTTKFFPMMMAFVLITLAGGVHAQGRGHHKGHDEHHGHHDDYRGEGHHNDRDHGFHDYRHEEARRVVYHEHDRYCDHPVIVVRDYHPRPRYIYYRDYDVYYDLERRVYITYSGRNWSISASLPVVLRRVELGRATRLEVDYVRDDFPSYVARTRPVYTRVYTSF
ncbi:MAG TPA: hypothetical protein VF490_10025 [Chryseosolibacter sp.]